MVWGILCWGGNLLVLGDIGWSQPKYCLIPPEYCMWDCLIQKRLVKSMLRSWVISQFSGLVFPPFLVLLLSTDCQKCTFPQVGMVKILPSPRKFGPKSVFHILTLLLRQGNFWFLGDSWSLSKYHSHDSQYSMGPIRPFKNEDSVGSCENFSWVLFSLSDDEKCR